MTAALRPRERRLLLLAAVVAAGAFAWVYGVEPLAERRSLLAERIAAREELLARQRRLLDREPRYAQELAVLQAELAVRRARLLPGDKAPLAASELQKLVKATAQDTGVEVRSERILPTSERGGYTEVPLEVTLSGPIRALTAFVHRLEGTPVTLGVTDLKLRVVSVAAPRELSATLGVTGYIATGAEGEPRPGRGEPAPRRPGA